ncbi:MAG: hypothetical protein QXU75_07630 [Candidatus Methanomethylicaceae archaeon]
MKKIRKFIEEAIEKREKTDKAKIIRVYTGRADIRLLGGTIYHNVKVIGGTSKLKKGDIVNIEWRYNKKARRKIPVVLGSGGLDEKVAPQDIANASATPAPNVIVMSGSDGTIHLGFLPTFLEGKNADMVDGKHAFEFATANHSHTFLSLSDTPGSYLGQANKVLAVNASESGIVFSDGASQSLGLIIAFSPYGDVSTYSPDLSGLLEAISDASSSGMTVIQIPPGASINISSTITINKEIALVGLPPAFLDGRLTLLQTTVANPMFDVTGTLFLSNLYLYSSISGSYNQTLSLISIGDGATLSIKQCVLSATTLYANLYGLLTSGSSTFTTVRAEHTHWYINSNNGSAYGVKLYCGSLSIHDCNVNVTNGNYGEAIGLYLRDSTSYNNHRITDTFIRVNSNNTSYGIRTYS